MKNSCEINSLDEQVENFLVEELHFLDKDGGLVCEGVAKYSADTESSEVPDIVWLGKARLLKSFRLIGEDGAEVELMDLLKGQEVRVAVTKERDTVFHYESAKNLVVVQRLNTLIDVAFLLHEFGHVKLRREGFDPMGLHIKPKSDQARRDELKKLRKIDERGATYHALVWMRQIKKKTGIDLFKWLFLKNEDEFFKMKGHERTPEGIVTNVRLALKEAYKTFFEFTD